MIAHLLALLLLGPAQDSPEPPAAFPIEKEAGFQEARSLWAQGEREQSLGRFRELCAAHPDDGTAPLAVASFLAGRGAFDLELEGALAHLRDDARDDGVRPADQLAQRQRGAKRLADRRRERGQEQDEDRNA